MRMKFKSEVERQRWRRKTIDAIVEVEMGLVRQAYAAAVRDYCKEYLERLPFPELEALLTTYGGPPPRSLKH